MCVWVCVFCVSGLNVSVTISPDAMRGCITTSPKVKRSMRVTHCHEQSSGELHKLEWRAIGCTVYSLNKDVRKSMWQSMCAGKTLRRQGQEVLWDAILSSFFFSCRGGWQWVTCLLWRSRGRWLWGRRGEETASLCAALFVCRLGNGSKSNARAHFCLHRAEAFDLNPVSRTNSTPTAPLRTSCLLLCL